MSPRALPAVLHRLDGHLAAAFADPEGGASYRLSTFFFLRVLGLIYAIAFLILCRQWLPLVGSGGLLPVPVYLKKLALYYGGSACWQLPSLFWIDASDAFMSALAYLGLGLSVLLLLGLANLPLLLALWILYSSFVNMGQVFYAFGWEILLLESGFLAIFLAPPLRPAPFAAAPPPRAVFGLLRWLLFRLMFGAGLIKVRGDACWRDLSCLFYHYETQPLPNPLSWYLHQLPPLFHEFGVLGTHIVELIVPFFFFAPRRWRLAGGLITAFFQFLLMLSGNLSWLNWMTLALCISCLDDAFLGPLFPHRLRAHLGSAPLSAGRRYALLALWALVLYLSVDPALNLLSSRQIMNSSFDRLHLVNTYGAFGSVGRERREVILEGTRAGSLDARTPWREYAFKAKPGDPKRRPPLVSPYHYHLDWQIWFAAMSDYRQHPWLVHLVYKLLHNDAGALSLLEGNPFPEGPPTYIRAELYRYRFSRPGEGGWWRRQRMGPYLPPLSARDPGLRRFLRSYGWLEAQASPP